MCIIDCLSTIVFILPLHLDYTNVIILILWWRNFQLEYWRTFQLVSTHMPLADNKILSICVLLGIRETKNETEHGNNKYGREGFRRAGRARGSH